MRRVMPLFMLLAACDTPAPYFKTSEVARIRVEASTFEVRVRGDLAEALRTNVQYAPRLGPIAARAQFAMEAVSGCRVSALRGDQARLVGQLDCGSGGRAWPQSPQLTEHYCDATEAYQSAATDELVLVLDCLAI